MGAIEPASQGRALKQHPADAIGLPCASLAQPGRGAPGTAPSAGISDTAHGMDWIVGMIDEVGARPNRPARYKLAKGTTEVLNAGVTVEMADARKRRG